MQTILGKLAGQTAVYGVSTILGRFLNYLLLPLHTHVFRDPQDYGVITEFYAYAAFLNIVFTYGMETAFFRFHSLSNDKQRVVSTAVVSLLVSSAILTTLLIIASQPLASILGYPDRSRYIVWFALILGLDALAAVPFARLRQQERPLLFAQYKLINIVVNVVLNVILLWAIPYYLTNHAHGLLTDFILSWYRSEEGVGYVFIANLMASAVTLLLLWRHVGVVHWAIDWELWKKMIRYALPLVLVGFAGMIDEMLSRAMLRFRLPLPYDQAMHQLGVFGANYKLAIVMTLFIQAFRMAAEPFFFNESKHANAPQTFARTMNMFVATGAWIFVAVCYYLEVFQILFLTPSYYEGARIVPILLMAQLFLGIYYNLTIWYKLTNRTDLGALLALYGAVLTIVLNWMLIPVGGYVAASWVTFACYGSLIILSYLIGQKFYPVPYQIKRIALYLIAAATLYFAGHLGRMFLPAWGYYIAATMVLIGFAYVIYELEIRRPARSERYAQRGE